MKKGRINFANNINLIFGNSKIFYFCYFLLLIELIFNIIGFSFKFLKYGSYFALIILILNVIVISLNSKKEIKISMLFTLTIVLIVSLISQNKQLLKIMLLILSFKNIDFKEFITSDFKFKFILFILIIIMSILGIIEGHDILLTEGSARLSFGFAHPNMLGFYILILCVEFFYLYHNSVKIWQFIIIMCVCLIFNMFATYSRSTMVSLLLLLIYICIPKKYIEKFLENTKIKKLLKNIYLIFFCLFISLSLIYSQNNNTIKKIDKLLSTRIYCANYYIKNYNILSPLGHNVIDLDNYLNGQPNLNYIPLDIGYIHILVRYGIVMTFIIMYLFYKTMDYLYKKKNYNLIIIFMLWAIYSTMETNALIDVYNPFLLVLSVNYSVNINHYNVQFLQKGYNKFKRFLKTS